jgi:hypothetical protein
MAARPAPLSAATRGDAADRNRMRSVVAIRHVRSGFMTPSPTTTSTPAAEVDGYRGRRRCTGAEPRWVAGPLGRPRVAGRRPLWCVRTCRPHLAGFGYPFWRVGVTGAVARPDHADGASTAELEDAARVLITASSPVAPLLAQACPTLRGRTGADAGRSASPYLSDARQERRRKTGCRQLRCADQRSGTDGRVGVEPELRARGTHRRDRGRRSRWPSRCLLVYHVPLGDLRSPWRRLCSAGRASPLFDRCVDMRATRRNCAVRDLAVRLPKSGNVGC